MAGAHGGSISAGLGEVAGHHQREQGKCHPARLAETWHIATADDLRNVFEGKG